MVDEKLDYYEARSWFWTRTFVWIVLAILVTAIGQYFFWNYYKLIGSASLKLWVSVAGGVGSVLLGLLGATISLEFVWMRLGQRYGYVINGPACAIISGVASFLLCGAILSMMQNDPYNPMSQAEVQTTYMLMQFGIGASMFWAFMLGSWFAMRRDKYFVEQI